MIHGIFLKRYLLIPVSLSLPVKGCNLEGYELKVSHKPVSPSDRSGRNLDIFCGINTLSPREEELKAAL